MASYLWIEGIAGTSTKPGHRNETEIESIAYGNLHGGMAGPTAGTARSIESFDAKMLGDVIVTKKLDAISPLLAQAAAGGKHFPTVVVTLSGTAGKGVSLFKITMKDVLISGVRVWGNDARETISFNYNDIAVDSASTA